MYKQLSLFSQEEPQVTNIFVREDWQPIPNHPEYLISRRGEILNINTNRIRVASASKDYPSVNLNNNSYLVHRLVAQAFIPNPLQKPYVNHKDGNRNNYNADNLEWVTHQENMHPSRCGSKLPKRFAVSMNYIEGEIWKDVVGAEDRYQVSDLGRVMRKEYIQNAKFPIGTDIISYNRPEPSVLVVQHTNVKGYVFVSVTVNGKRTNWKVHRLVAQAFIPNPLQKPLVNHINGIKSDNRLSNLEWVTASENILHTLDIGVKEQPILNTEYTLSNRQSDVLAMWNEALKRPCYKAELARMFNMNADTVKEIFNREKWAFLTADLPDPIFNTNTYAASNREYEVLAMWNEALKRPCYKAELARMFNMKIDTVRAIFKREKWAFLTADLPDPVFNTALYVAPKNL